MTTPNKSVEEIIQEHGDFMWSTDSVRKALLSQHKQTGEIRKETLKELISEYQANEIEGKGYDFYFAIRTKIDEVATAYKNPTISTEIRKGHIHKRIAEDYGYGRGSR